MIQETEVLVVGAGPVGLMLAYLLRKQGIQCRIIDKMIKRQGYCKALGIQPRTLEVWDDVGLLNPMINEGLCFKETRIFQNGKEVQSNPIALAELPFGFLSLPQFKLEDILINEVQELGLAIEQGVELLNFAQNAQQILAVLRDNKTGVAEKIHTNYLVGCDGAHSLTRHLLNLSFEGGKFPQSFMLADVRVDWVFPHPVNYRFNYSDEGFENAVIFVPYRGDRRFRVSTTVPEKLLAEIKNDKPTLEQFAEILKKAVPVAVKLDDLRWSSMYQISHRIVNHYSSGRVFLAGDAAHIHPPVGGQGLNTGIQDVYNLAWKLALVLKKRAKPALLETYHEERYPVGLDVVNRTHERMLARDVASSDAHYALLVNSQTLINYRNSSLSRGKPESSVDWSYKPGDRAPDLSMLQRDIMNFTLRLFEVLRGPKFKLLIYADSTMNKKELETLLATSERLRQSLSLLVDSYLIAPKDFTLSENSSLTLLSDLQNNFKTVYQAKAGSVYLIRPDNYLAYRSDRLEEAAVMRSFERIISMEPLPKRH